MNAGASPAAENIRHLEQGIELIRLLDELNGFGVAPSTVRHWKESGSPAG